MGEKPLIKPVVINAERQVFKKAKYFFHMGQRRGSLTSSEGRGMRTMSVPCRCTLWIMSRPWAAVSN
jgi:hypothetical protein